MPINNVTINFTFAELDENPISKIDDLQKEFVNVFHSDLVYNQNLKNYYDINIPRMQVISSDKKMHFVMSMIGASISIFVNDLDQDEVILLINEKIQYFYDVLKNIFDVDILYSSVKLELSEENNSVIDILKDKYHLTDKDYEDLFIKTVSKVEDCYYLCEILSSSKEFNFNINLKEGINANDQDMFYRTSLISIKDANVNKIMLNKTIEINDRLAFNIDPQYRTNKENLRGIIMEIKKVLKDN